MVYRQGHQDPAGGRQYHVRYWSTDGNRYYWTTVTDSLERAKKIQEIWNSYERDAKIFVRDVSPWREL